MRRSSTSSTAHACRLHKAGDEVRVFSRTLNDVTASVPEIVTLVRALPARELILDGEVIALESGRHAAIVSDHDAPFRPDARRRGPAGTSCR